MNKQTIAAILDCLCTEARNSMHAVFGFMELAYDVPGNPAQLASAAVGRASADQFLRTLDDLRELVCDEAPAPFAVEDLYIVPLVSETAEVLNAASARRRRRITVDVPSQLLPVRQDRRSLEQIFSRTLRAASKLAPGTELFVSFSDRMKDGVRVVINTRDSGLSSRLVQWLNSTLDEVSLGAPGDLPHGVSVMVAGKRLRALGGLAGAVRDPAGHDSVAIDLPVRLNAGETTASEMTPDALSVLVAEDNDESYYLTELMLENESVRRARDGEEALRMVQKQRFDLVLMDVHMPGMDGYTAIRGIRDWETETCNARTPLVVLSSDDLETQQRSAAASGCSGFLRKPLRRADLQSLIARLKEVRSCVA